MIIFVGAIVWFCVLNESGPCCMVGDNLFLWLKIRIVFKNLVVWF